MKQFNLEEYLKNPSRKVITRDGRKARIICTDAKNDFPIVALIETSDGKETLPCGYKKDGTYITGEKLSCDLFFATKKHKGWINVYRDTDTGTTSFGAVLYVSRKEAEEVGKSDDYYVATAKIEWGE